MANLNRKISPKFNLIDKLNYIDINKHLLDNGIEVYELNSDYQDVIKLEISFKAGTCESENILIPSFTNSMLIQSTKSKSSSEIAEKLDFYGSYVSLESGKHFSSVVLYSLTSFFEQSVEIVEDIIKNPTFPKNEFLIDLQNEKQQFIVSQEKVEYIAHNSFYEAVFGNKHPYGQVLKIEDFKKLKIDKLKDFHKRFYSSDNCTIVISGKTNNETFKILNDKFGKTDWKNTNNIKKANYSFIEQKNQKIILNKKDAVQTSLVIGCRTITKTHPDFLGLNVLNEIFGGYFGSRLMLNLREKKALTYGIYSYINSLLKSGIFIISANIPKGFEEKAIEEIYKEIKTIKEIKVQESELELVRNYMMGEILRAFDGHFNQSEIFLNLLQFGLTYKYFDDYIQTLKTITPENIMELANKYLQTDIFTQVLAGDL
ncbi:MAG: insulinase family protein [Bacteroidales bacterium]|nr:insulinase family protein [Bacteroidales bacterium]MBN2756653.1 insulinase family protein [Bacteroidales bacterium]